ncbi:arabinanase [Salipaludibacillus neizhouensis]|uniref:Arabinanase n=1 Tax=Salipaludibacillus neizhouensis TaxID=885475 RepID=A0A3A9K465_9BACI|nr:LamG-like jellyroll fold domain-containing protein [Salipaludibacillus neizhouensis]RKL67427.1 arabinanase [Salipaludibacillus neizhouensis]
MQKTTKKRIGLILFLLLLIIPITVFSQGYSGKNNANSNKPNQENQKEVPSFQEASVHDPSIIKAGDTYYAFGTHIDAAKSTDLMEWSNFTNGYTTPDNTLYGDLSENLAGSFEWAGEDDSDSAGGFAVWAPEAVWNEHYEHEDGSTGAYMMYYSASSTYIRSAIGYAVSKDVEGPYSYVDTIMYSDFHEKEGIKDAGSDVNKNWKNTNLPDLIEDGTIEGIRDEWFLDNGGYNYNDFTNSIDANLFFDEDGKMWMTYGSWAGGIFILEVDPTTGQPIYPGKDGVTEDGRMIDRYFGTKISGGYGRSGEGPYVNYDEETGYYFLYVTYGWLGADGGYQMRSFRSENPEGPYVDAAGDPAILPDSLDNGIPGNKPDSLEHADHGNKLMGNFLFERKVGDPGSGNGYGYMSPGHNSIFTDPDTGKRFLVFHTRFPDKGEMHELRVHQMFENKEGWLVAAPYRYAGEELAKVNRQDLIGDYQYINHGSDITGDIEKASYISLNKNNKISGAVEGSWKKTSHNQAEITIDNVTYDGVFIEQWDHSSESYVMTFTAMSQEGVTVWGSKMLDKTDEEIVEDVANDLSLGDIDNVISNVTLPVEGTRNSEITWETSDETVVTDSGEINRPGVDAEFATATLTATITKGDVSETKSFELTVLPTKEAGLVAHYPFENDLEESTGNFESGASTGDRLDNSGGTITFEDGQLGRAAAFDGESGVSLPDGLISSDAYSVSLWLKPEKLTPFTTAFFGATDPDNWISLLPSGTEDLENTMIWSGSSTWYDANTEMTIGTDEWTHLAFTVADGNIQIYINGEEKHTGSDFPNVFTNTSAKFGLGVNYWDTPYQGLMDDLQIYEGLLSPEEIKNITDSNE